MIFLSKKELIENEEERSQIRFSSRPIGMIIKSICIFWFLFLSIYFIFSDSTWIFSIFSIVPPISFLITSLILFALVVFITFSIDKTFKNSALLSVLGAILISTFFSDVFILRTNNEIQDEDYILFNFNTEFWEDSEDIENFYQFLKQQNADIYQLQEYIPAENENDHTKVSLDLTLDYLKEKFPNYEVIQFGEFVTMTRLPIFSYEEQLDKKFLRTDIRIDDEIVSFYNVHMPVHVNTDLRPDYVSLLKDMKERYSSRHELFYQLINELKTNNRPKIISGDFNTTKSMRKMGSLMSFLNDAALEAEKFLVTSWEIKGLRAWRIDYVLGDQSITFSDYKTIDSTEYSDHWAQRVLFRLTKQTQKE
ncbi:hypothetical protein KC669_00870 [Candidatus Dojkabacteria bacterium]|uniref:Endonuclease/exonuclease/phosphatase domain-containing protein n=1 Tax=Candidatus Dojkabacteria bacterium TaxID=2099670 RepID=A0A955LAI0_9BACT|nr:hypothetical protein [Candidatus Dojkabacteria bacterium]